MEDPFHGININETLYQPLYEGANLSVLDSYFQLMQFSLRHSLTKQAFSDLLNVIGLHLPTNPTMSAYRLKKFFLTLYHDISFTKHHCCSSCDTILNTTGACSMPGCKGSAIEFLSISIAAQLKRKLEGMIQYNMWITSFVCITYIKSGGGRPQRVIVYILVCVTDMDQHT